MCKLHNHIKNNLYSDLETVNTELQIYIKNEKPK